jgi:hypothetical protein
MNDAFVGRVTDDLCPVCCRAIVGGQGVPCPLLRPSWLHRGACAEVVAGLEFDCSGSTKGRLRTRRELLSLLKARRVLVDNRTRAGSCR